MSARPATVVKNSTAIPSQSRMKPSFHLSDLWKAPLHDLQIRDEILFQYFPLSPETELLEIGPGNGFTAFRLCRQIQNVVAVDVAAGNVEALRSRLRGIRNFSVVEADLCAPGLDRILDGRAFDRAIGIEILEFLPDPAMCLKNVASVLRPGGELMLNFPNYPPPRNAGVTHFEKRQEFEHILAEAGFSEWEIFALKLRPWAQCLYDIFHERPLNLYRRRRNKKSNYLPQTYDQTWTHQARGHLEPIRIPLNIAWSLMFGLFRLGGDCFERVLLKEDILNHNLLVIARR